MHASHTLASNSRPLETRMALHIAKGHRIASTKRAMALIGKLSPLRATCWRLGELVGQRAGEQRGG
eukprot:577122-Alexandrium_andersonii.AAC.1